MKQKGTTWGNVAKTGVTAYGYGKALTTGVTGIILLIIGLILSFKDYKRSAFTNATVTNEPKCDEYFEKNKKKYKCPLELKFKVGEKVYNVNHVAQKRYFKNNTIKIRYDPKKPTSFDTFPFDPRYIGYVLTFIGFFTLLYGIGCGYFPLICGGVSLAQNTASAIRGPSRRTSFGTTFF